MNTRFSPQALALLLLCGGSFAAQLEIPDPPQVPQILQISSTADVLKTRRDELMARKKAWMANVQAFNSATVNEVSQAEAARLEEWRNRLLAERADFLKGFEALRLDINAALAQIKLGTLREKVRETQEGLLRLERQSELTSTESEHWREVTEHTVDHAEDMLADILTDALLTVPAARLQGTYAEIGDSLSKEMQHAASLIAGESEPARRERLQAAFQLLSHQRETVGQVEHLLGNLKQAQAAKSLDQLTRLPEGQQFKAGMQQLLLAAGDEKLQESLQHDFGLSFPVMTKLAKGLEGYGYAEKVVDAAYDLTSVSIAWKRINQQNSTSEQVLKAINLLGERVKTLVTGMKEIEAAMPAH